MKKLLCIFFHKWEYGYLCNKKGKNVKAHRTCLNCNKEQILDWNEKEYNPLPVWLNHKQ